MRQAMVSNDTPEGVEPDGRPRSGSFVYPGEVYVGDTSSTLTTVVGACVAVCLRDVSGRVGGMAHFLLPYGAGSATTRMRFANNAIPELIDLVRKETEAEGTLEAKIVGGASVATSFPGSRQRLEESNLAAARQYLTEAGIDVAVEVVGGEVGRKVIYEVHDGSMWVNELRADLPRESD
jgi:chemotaxis protein CheD